MLIEAKAASPATKARQSLADVGDVLRNSLATRRARREKGLTWQNSRRDSPAIRGGRPKKQLLRCKSWRDNTPRAPSKRWPRLCGIQTPHRQLAPWPRIQFSTGRSADRHRRSTRLANEGCTDHQIMAWGGWTTLKEVQRYTRKANRRRLAQCAAEKLTTGNIEWLTRATG